MEDTSSPFCRINTSFLRKFKFKSVLDNVKLGSPMPDTVIDAGGKEYKINWVLYNIFDITDPWKEDK